MYSSDELSAALKHIDYDEKDVQKNDRIASGLKHELGAMKGFSVWADWAKPTNRTKARAAFRKIEPKDNAQQIIDEAKAKNAGQKNVGDNEKQQLARYQREVLDPMNRGEIPDVQLDPDNPDDQEFVAYIKKERLPIPPAANEIAVDSKAPEKVNLANDPEYQAQKNTTVAAAVKDSDSEEQVRKGEEPDSARERADKDLELRTDPELTKQMASMESELNREQASRFVVPQNVSMQYVKAEDKNVFFDKETRQVAIDASNPKVMRTHNKDANTIHNMVEMAKANNWNSIKLKGTEEFRREAWFRASMAGLKVKGYSPTREEKQFVKGKLAEQKTAEVGNSIEKSRNIAASYFKEKIATLKAYKVEHKKTDQMATKQTPTKPVQQPKIEVVKSEPTKEITK
ncbi:MULTISPECIES: LPD7 domain-containing protein [Snodgrassella]|uniref:LPD7 domain-containing protein n=1 Tax=Snodgrassella TaxID=1193515 RepID=UPI0008160930|nr:MULTISPECIES: LPD7 domain-containing protein [Snodgrassella]SCC04507.1 hypothetical protein GA0061082_10727 [Snodgrassella sp. R-53583]